MTEIETAGNRKLDLTQRNFFTVPFWNVSKEVFEGRELKSALVIGYNPELVNLVHRRDAGCKVTVIEQSEDAIEDNKTILEAGETKIIIGRFPENLPEDVADVDGVFGPYTLRHAKQKDRTEYILKVQKVLKTDGLACLSVHTLADSKIAQQLRDEGFDFDEDPIGFLKGTLLVFDKNSYSLPSRTELTSNSR